MQRRILYILPMIVLMLCGVGSAYALEPDYLSDRLAYNESFDPTTIFLHMESNEDELSRQQLVDDIIDYARTFLGRPYRSGAKGPSAFDCSGYTSYIFKNFDIQLSPSSRTQYTQGEKIDIADVEPGDLLFFTSRRSGKGVGHVGMVVDVDGDGTVTFIHASTSQGIRYDTYPDGGYFSNRFVGAKRVIE